MSLHISSLPKSSRTALQSCHLASAARSTLLLCTTGHRSSWSSSLHEHLPKPATLQLSTNLLESACRWRRCTAS